MHNNGRPGDQPLPPEVATWKIERPTTEMLEEARRTFNMEEYLEQERELLKSGGGDIDALIEELRREIHGQA